MEANSREPGRWKAIIILKAFHLSSGFVLVPLQTIYMLI